MENAAKALLIAGGMLILILVISLLVVFRGQLAAYMEQQHDEKLIRQAVEFNNKFADYQGKDVRGNELISIMNRIIDYNSLQAEQYGFEKIAITVDIGNSQNLWEKLKYNKKDESIFSTTGNYITNQNGNNDTNISKLTGLSAELVQNSGIPRIDDNKLQRLSANIAVIFAESNDADKLNRAQKLTSILGYRVNEEGYTVDKNGNKVSIDEANSYILDKVKTATSKYYQLTQFKRIMFTCTEIKYDAESSERVNGRINGMKFKIQTDSTGEIIFN